MSHRFGTPLRNMMDWTGLPVEYIVPLDFKRSAATTHRPLCLPQSKPTREGRSTC